MVNGLSRIGNEKHMLKSYKARISSCSFTCSSSASFDHISEITAVIIVFMKVNFSSGVFYLRNCTVKTLGRSAQIDTLYLVC